MSPTPIVVLLPVKPPAIAKSRLQGPPAEIRRALAEAFALDTASAATQTTGVIAVLAITDDFRFAARLRAIGCEVIPDATTGGLNAVLTQAAADAVRRWPDALPVAMCADLPSLQSAELAEVLAALPADNAAFVADALGTGTTLYSAPAELFAPRFGEQSATAHREDGATQIDAAPSVRRDVDDLDDLNGARVLGVGAHTAKALADIV